MRKITFILFSVLFMMCSCKGQHKDEQTKRKSITEKKIVKKKDTSMEHFDIENFNKHVVDDERNFTDNKGNVIRQFKTNDGFQEEVTAPDNYFVTSKSFYEKGSIKEKGNIFHGNGFVKGLWINYDENGNIIKQTDYDAPFKFSWDDVLQFMKKKNINPMDNFTYVNRTISSLPAWHLSWDTKEVAPDGKKILKNVTIDGITGKISKEETVHYDY